MYRYSSTFNKWRIKEKYKNLQTLLPLLLLLLLSSPPDCDSVYISDYSFFFGHLIKVSKKETRQTFFLNIYLKNDPDIENQDRSSNSEENNGDNVDYNFSLKKKNRTNISILNNIKNINYQSSNILYMDWKGREGYLVLLF